MPNVILDENQNAPIQNEPLEVAVEPTPVVEPTNPGIEEEKVCGRGGKVDGGGELVGQIVACGCHVIAGVVGALNIDMGVETRPGM